MPATASSCPVGVASSAQMPTASCASKELNLASLVNSGFTTKTVCTYAWDAVRNCLIQAPSSKAAVAGQAFTNLLVPMASTNAWT